MYKQHIIACYVVGVSVFLCSYCFNFSYACIASDALTLVSIVLAVYIAVPSALLGSTYSRILKKSKDNKIPTQLKCPQKVRQYFEAKNSSSNRKGLLSVNRRRQAL